MQECEDNTERLGEFIRLWRSNFLQSMEPKYLPLGWRVDHTIERSFGKESVFNKNPEDGSDEPSSQSPDQRMEARGGAGE